MRLLRLSQERPDAAIKTAVQKAIGLAAEEWKPAKYEGSFPESGFGIATLRPKDICYDGSTLTGTAGSTIAWIFSLAAASTWYDLVNVTLSQDIYIVVTGVQSRMADPSLTNIKFVVDGKEYPVENIEEMYGWDLARAFFTEPVVGMAGKQFKIRGVGTKASTAEYFGPIGHAIAKRSFLIRE